MNEQLQSVYRTLFISGIAILLAWLCNNYYGVSYVLAAALLIGVGVIMTRTFWEVAAILIATIFSLFGSIGRGSDRFSDRLNEWVRPSEAPETDDLDSGPDEETEERPDESQLDSLDAMMGRGSRDR